MAHPDALVLLSKYGVAPVSLQQTDHFRLTWEFCADPAAFVAVSLDEVR